MSVLQIYVKATSNCLSGMPLTTFEELSPTWSGESLYIPFGPSEGKRKRLRVVGWTDLFNGRPCPVHVVKARHESAEGPGYLIYGGNSGVRVLTKKRPAKDDATLMALGDYDAHLPPGFGMPIIWIEDIADLPRKVRAVVERPKGED